MPSLCPNAFRLPPLPFAPSLAATGRQVIERFWDAAIKGVGDEAEAAKMGGSNSDGGTGSGDRSHPRRLLDTVLRIAYFCHMIGEFVQASTTVDHRPADHRPSC